MDDWHCPDEALKRCKKALSAMDTEALRGDVPATKAAAREYCEAWRAAFRSATEKY